MFYASCAFGLTLLISARAKFASPQSFARVVRSYDFSAWVPAALLPRFIPIAEAIAAGLLLSFYPLAVRIGLWFALFLVASASIAILVRVLRGEKRFACGCSSEIEREHSGRFLLIRNAILIGVLAWMLAYPSDRLGRWTEAVPILMTTLSGLMAWRLAAAARIAIRSLGEWNTAG